MCKSGKPAWLTVLVIFLTAGVLFSACSGKGSGTSGPVTGEIRFSWWGNEARNEATIEAMRLYESLNPGTSIVAEYSAYDGYNIKIQAQVAAGNAPDIFTTVAEDLPTYVDIGAGLDLTGLVDVSTHNPEIVRASSIDGKMYGVNLSLNANILIYNKTQADELGIKMPEGDYTWDDLLDLLVEVYEKSGRRTYGMMDLRMMDGLGSFVSTWNLTHRGKEPPFPFTNDEMIMTGEDVAAYMDFWTQAPEGVLLPPDETALISIDINAPIGVRRTFLDGSFSGTFAMIQSQTQTGDEFAMIEYPNNRKGRGEAVSARPGLVQMIFSGSKNKPLAIDFLQWISSDAEAGKLLGTVRGVLPSSVQVEALLADSGRLSVNDQKVFDITNRIYSGNVNPFFPGISGMSAIWDASNMLAVGAEVAFGRITPKQAGERFDEFVADVLDW